MEVIFEGDGEVDNGGHKTLSVVAPLLASSGFAQLEPPVLLEVEILPPLAHETRPPLDVESVPAETPTAQLGTQPSTIDPHPPLPATTGPTSSVVPLPSTPNPNPGSSAPSPAPQKAASPRGFKANRFLLQDAQRTRLQPTEAASRSLRGLPQRAVSPWVPGSPRNFPNATTTQAFPGTASSLSSTEQARYHG